MAVCHFGCSLLQPPAPPSQLPYPTLRHIPTCRFRYFGVYCYYCLLVLAFRPGAAPQVPEDAIDPQASSSVLCMFIDSPVMTYFVIVLIPVSVRWFRHHQSIKAHAQIFQVVKRNAKALTLNAAALIVQRGAS